MPTTKSATSVASGNSAERSMALLALLADEGRPLPLAELAARLGLPKGTVHRMCMQLLQGGYIARDLNERDFAVGPALRKLAFNTLNHETVRGLRHDLLCELVAQIKETCNFTTLDAASVLYLDRVEAPWPWRLKLDAGEHVPLHCTASGKLFLALMPRPRRETLLAQMALPRMTHHTITSAKALREECAAVAAAGHAIDNEEFIEGLIAIAVPVVDASQSVLAALAVHASTSRVSRKQVQTYLPALQAAAERMGRLL